MISHEAVLTETLDQLIFETFEFIPPAARAAILEKLAAEIRRGIDRRAPVPELKGTFPIVLYFGNAEDRDAFAAIVHEAKPTLRLRHLRCRGNIPNRVASEC